MVNTHRKYCMQYFFEEKIKIVPLLQFIAKIKLYCDINKLYMLQYCKKSIQCYIVWLGDTMTRIQYGYIFLNINSNWHNCTYCVCYIARDWIAKNHINCTTKAWLPKAHFFKLLGVPGLNRFMILYMHTFQPPTVTAAQLANEARPTHFFKLLWEAAWPTRLVGDT